MTTPKELIEEYNLWCLYKKEQINKEYNRIVRKAYTPFILCAVAIILIAAAMIALSVLTTLHITVVMLGVSMFVSVPIILKGLYEAYIDSEEKIHLMWENFKLDLDDAWAICSHRIDVAVAFEHLNNSEYFREYIISPLSKVYKDEDLLADKAYSFFTEWAEDSTKYEELLKTYTNVEITDNLIQY